jgi:anaerobic C4-dicarboxylate transporter DcuA
LVCGFSIYLLQIIASSSLIFLIFAFLKVKYIDMLIQLLFVLVAIIIGARLGGIGLGVMGGVGLAILTFVFGLQPTAPPIDVMLMIAAVISAASCMQAAGGLDYMVKIAERMLRKNPSHVTILAPFVTYFFTFLAGTGHVAYSVLPVIAEVAAETKIRPERPLGIAVIASQQGITASPISAATVALLGLLAGFDITLFDILKICVPATIIGILVGAFYSMRVGKELMDDPEYLRRLKDGMLEEKHVQLADVKNLFNARLSVGMFIAATLLIVLFGSVPSLRPSFDGNALGMPILIEILMLSAAALILLLTKTDGIKATQGSIFPAGMQAVIAIFGIAWMGDTFINGNITELTASIEGIVTEMPWLFGLALFVMSILLYSQAATVRAIVPLGIALGISPMMLIALFPAVNGYFFIPNYPTVVAAINFDRTGTTGIGKWILNHSFMMPGLITTITSIAVGLLLIQIF